MDKHPKYNKKWLLYGALVSFIIAIIGVLLLFFVFNGGKKHHIGDDDEEDEDDVELIDEEQVKDDYWDDEWDDWGEEMVLPDSDMTPIKDELPAPSNDDQSIYDVVDPMPQFLDGDMVVWLGNHIKYPSDLEETDVQGIVICQFVIEPDGSVSNVEVLRGVYPSLDKEAVRVIESMPKWAPGKKDGQPVRVKYTIPIKFQLQ